MELQKRLASQLLGCGVNRIRLDPERLEEIKSAITKQDVLQLIKKGAIKKLPLKGISRARAKARHLQKIKGRRKGKGSRKGSAKARGEIKRAWVLSSRGQRALLKRMKISGLIDNKAYRLLYNKAKGGFFRSRRHIKAFVQEQGLLKK